MRVCVLAILLLGCGDQEPPCATRLERCGSACVDLTSDGQNCGACGNTCPGYLHCSSSQCVSGPVACEPPSKPCFSEHGVGGCCSENQVCVGTPMTVQCLDTCTTSSQCTGGCCTTAHTCGPPTQCLCTTSSECPSGACAPQTNAAGDPIGPMICKPNDGALYDGCNGTTCASGCCVADVHANHFCATACIDSTSCGAAHCNSYDFSAGTCGGPTACGP